MIFRKIQKMHNFCPKIETIFSGTGFLPKILQRYRFFPPPLRYNWTIYTSVNNCKNWSLKVFFEGIKWIDMLTTPLTTTARTLVLKKNPISTLCLKRRINLKTNIVVWCFVDSFMNSFQPKRVVMQNFWSDIICRFEWTRPLIGCPQYLPLIPAPYSSPVYLPPIAAPYTCN